MIFDAVIKDRAFKIERCPFNGPVDCNPLNQTFSGIYANFRKFIKKAREYFKNLWIKSID